MWSSRSLRTAILLLSLVVVAADEPASDATTETLDQGTFTLYLNGTRIGEERFVIRQESDRDSGLVMVSAAEINLKLDGRTMRIQAALEAAGTPPTPRRYEAKINGSDLTTIVATVLPDRVVLHVQSPEGEEMKQLLVPGESAILDRYIAHHYFFACKLLGDRSSAEINAIVPRDRTQRPLRIEDLGPESVPINGQELRLRHITMTDREETVHHVWLDGDKVMKVEVPLAGFGADRSDLPSPSTQPLGGA